MGKAVSLANQKGGVGKTTTAVNLAAALCKKGQSVLLIDLDPQGNASSGLGFDSSMREVNIYNVLIGQIDLADIIRPTSVSGLDMVLSSSDLYGAEVELVNDYSRSTKLRRHVHAVRGRYDFVLIDCPPSLGLLTVNALAASDSLVVPLQAEYYAMEGLSQLMRTVGLIQAGLNPNLKVEGILLTMFDVRNNLCHQVENEIRNYFGRQVFRTKIPRNVRLSECPSFGVPIFDYDPTSKGAQSYQALADEFLARNGAPVESDAETKGDIQENEGSGPSRAMPEQGDSEHG